MHFLSPQYWDWTSHQAPTQLIHSSSQLAHYICVNSLYFSLSLQYFTEFLHHSIMTPYYLLKHLIASASTFSLGRSGINKSHSRALQCVLHRACVGFGCSLSVDLSQGVWWKVAAVTAGGPPTVWWPYAVIKCSNEWRQVREILKISIALKSDPFYCHMDSRVIRGVIILDISNYPDDWKPMTYESQGTP